MRARVWIEIQAPQLCIENVFDRRREGIRRGRIAFEKLITIDDLQRSANGGPVTEVNAVA
jgi:hypothetical protein